MCVRSDNPLEFHLDSRIGSFKIPYFANKISKKFLSEDYKLNEKTAIEVKAKNSGYDTAKYIYFTIMKYLQNGLN